MKYVYNTLLLFRTPASSDTSLFNIPRHLRGVAGVALQLCPCFVASMLVVPCSPTTPIRIRVFILYLQLDAGLSPVIVLFVFLGLLVFCFPLFGAALHFFRIPNLRQRSLWPWGWSYGDIIFLISKYLIFNPLPSGKYHFPSCIIERWILWAKIWVLLLGFAPWQSTVRWAGSLKMSIHGEHIDSRATSTNEKRLSYNAVECKRVTGNNQREEVRIGYTWSTLGHFRVHTWWIAL